MTATADPHHQTPITHSREEKQTTTLSSQRLATEVAGPIRRELLVGVGPLQKPPDGYCCRDSIPDQDWKRASPASNLKHLAG